MLLPLLQLNLPISAERMVELVCEGQVDAAFELFENAHAKTISGDAESSKLAPAWTFYQVELGRDCVSSLYVCGYRLPGSPPIIVWICIAAANVSRYR